MRLKDLQDALSEYRSLIARKGAGQWLFLWETQRIFQENWDLDAPDLAAMFDRSLESTQTRKMWNRDNFYPKRMMLQFMRQQQEFTRQMFAGLFREDISIEGRASRFVLYCDELLQDHLERNPTEKVFAHYHDDEYQTIFLYLAMRWPEMYTCYDFGAFIATLRRIGAQDIPLTHDLERFVKISRTLFQLMQKDEALIAAHQRRLLPGRDYMGASMLLVFDFMQSQV
jgi:hypothetical protein